MRRIINRLVIVVLVVVTALFAAFLVWQSMKNRNTPPLLQCESDVVEVSIHDDPKAFLAGVTASDKEDGDLTGSVIVESLSRFTEKGVCRVTYAVSDSKNAVVKTTRTLRYTDYVSPQFSLKAPLVFDYGKSFDPTVNLSVVDCIDGDLSNNIQMTLLENEATISGVGNWNVEFRVTNSMGETSYLTTTVTVQEAGTAEKKYAPVIALNTYLVYLPVGAAFNPADYITGVTVSQNTGGDNPIELRARTQNSSNVNTAVPGTYAVTYSCNSKNGYVGTTRLVVVVVGDTAR